MFIMYSFFKDQKVQFLWFQFRNVTLFSLFPVFVTQWGNFLVCAQTKTSEDIISSLLNIKAATGLINWLIKKLIVSLAGD